MSKIRVLVVAVFIIFLGLCLLFAPSKAQRLVAELKEEHLLINDLNRPAIEALQFLTHGTKFETKWQINGIEKKNFLNLYVFRPDPQPRQKLSPDLLSACHNAAYVGTPNIVVIDANVLNELAEQFDLYRYVKSMPTHASQEAEIRKALLTWILGHEIGHILCGHKPAHFKSDRVEENSPTDRFSRNQEMEADTKFANILRTRPAIRTQVEIRLIDLINFEIKKSLGIVPQGVMILYDYKDERIVHYRETNSHPEFVLRATRLLLITSQEPGSEALREETQRFAALLKPIGPQRARQ